MIKLYLRPGISEGFAHTKTQKILTVTDDEKVVMLPKYDWPEKLVFQTPDACRICIKEPIMSNENEDKEKS